jgi:hypothetical protein
VSSYSWLSTGECFSESRRGRSANAAKSRCSCYPYYAKTEFLALWFVRWGSRVYLTKLLPAGLQPGSQPDRSTSRPLGQPMAARREAYAGTESRKDAPFRRRKLGEPLQPHQLPTSAQGQELCAIGPHKSMMMRMLMMTIYFRPAASKSKPIGARLLV